MLDFLLVFVSVQKDLHFCFGNYFLIFFFLGETDHVLCQISKSDIIQFYQIPVFSKYGFIKTGRFSWLIICNFNFHVSKSLLFKKEIIDFAYIVTIQGQGNNCIIDIFLRISFPYA